MNNSSELQSIGYDPSWFPDRFQNVCLFGKGTFSNVYAAHDTHLDREVAIKVVFHDASLSSRRREFANQEIRVLSTLNHPGIVRLLDVSRDPNATLIIQSLCSRGTLDQDANVAQASYLTKMAIIESILRAIQYLHAQGWIHGDIKPANILLDSRGSAYLSDFGNARQISQLNGNVEKLGSIGYMAPEMLQGKAGPSILTDVYSTGVTLFELLTGRKAFSDDSLSAIQGAVASGIPPVSEVIPDFGDWNAVLRKATELDRGHRYQNICELATDVQRIRQGQSVSVREISTLERLVRWTKKEPITSVLILSLLAMILLGSFASGATWFEVSRQSSLSRRNQSDLERLTKESLAAKIKLDESIALVKAESENAIKSEQAASDAVNRAASINTRLMEGAEEAIRLNSELASSLEELKRNTQNRIALEMSAEKALESESKLEAKEYWRLLEKAFSHLEMLEYPLALETLDLTPQRYRRLEYALLRGLAENKWSRPKQTELGSIEFDKDDDSEKFVALSPDASFFARCSRQELKILNIRSGKVSSNKLPAVRGILKKIFMQFDDKNKNLHVVVVCDAQGYIWTLNHIDHGNVSEEFLWQAPSPRAIKPFEGNCIGLTGASIDRTFLVCAKKTETGSQIQLVNATSGKTDWSFDLDEVDPTVELVRSAWLPRGHHALFLNERLSLLLVDDGKSLCHIETDFKATDSILGKRIPLPENRSRKRSELLPLFVHPKMPDRIASWSFRESAWSEEKKSWAIVEKAQWRCVGLDGSVGLNLDFGHMIGIADDFKIYMVKYLEFPAFGREYLPAQDASAKHPKAVLVQYDFGATSDEVKRIDEFSPFRNRTPIEVLQPPALAVSNDTDNLIVETAPATRTSNTRDTNVADAKNSEVKVVDESTSDVKLLDASNSVVKAKASADANPVAPTAEYSFFIDTEEPDAPRPPSIHFRCYHPGGGASPRKTAEFRQPVKAIEQLSSKGTSYRIYVSAGPDFQILRVDVELAPGKVVDLGRLKLKRSVVSDEPIVVSGVIYDSKKVPLAGATVIASWRDENQMQKGSYSSKETTTNQDGTYQLADLKGVNNNGFGLRASKNGYLTTSHFSLFADELRQGNSQIHCDLSLGRARRIVFRYVTSKHRSDSFESTGEIGTMELDLEQQKLFLANVTGLKREFAECVVNERLSFYVSGNNIYLRGECPIRTLENDSEIKEDGPVGVEQATLVAGKTLLIRGFDPTRSDNRSNYCAKMIIESIDE